MIEINGFWFIMIGIKALIQQIDTFHQSYNGMCIIFFIFLTKRMNRNLKRDKI